MLSDLVTELEHLRPSMKLSFADKYYNCGHLAISSKFLCNLFELEAMQHFPSEEVYTKNSLFGPHIHHQREDSSSHVSI